MYLMSAVFRGSYGVLIRDQRTQVKFHLGVKDLETGLLKANPLRSEIIGSAVRSAALDGWIFYLETLNPKRAYSILYFLYYKMSLFNLKLKISRIGMFMLKR